MTVEEELQLKDSLGGCIKHMMFHLIKRCREKAGITGIALCTFAGKKALNNTYRRLTDKDRQIKPTAATQTPSYAE
jgi:hypothetical protein